MKNILITGTNSYIGTSLERWLYRMPEQYSVESINMKDDSWKATNFSKYDIVFHVAGIAHVSANPAMKGLYYLINRDLAIETATKAKESGVKQFIFMSSIIVYGNSKIGKRIIDQNTDPVPSDFYGDSKLQAENGLRKMETKDFKIVILRPPMIYGQGSKGNYPRLSKLAKHTPIFPQFENIRSVLHTDNLCELIKSIIDQEDNGTFFPQNIEYVSTSDLVREIGFVNGRKIWMTNIFNPLIVILSRLEIVNKIFGDLAYDKSLSDYNKSNYRIRSFKQSIELSENIKN